MFKHHVKLPMVAILSTAALLAADPSPAAESRPVAPDWQLLDVNGKQVNLAEFKGEVSGFKFLDQGFTDNSAFEAQIRSLL